MNWIRSASVTVRFAVAKTEPSAISSQVRPRTSGSTSDDGTTGWVVVMSGLPRGCAGWSWPGFPGHPQDGLGEDGALDLRGAGVDGPGPGVQVAADPRAGGSRGTRVVGAVAAQGRPAGDDLRAHAGQVEGEVGGPLVVLAPVELRDGGLRARLLPGEVPGEHPVPEEPHDLHLDQQLGQAVADDRVAGPALGPGELHQPVELGPEQHRVGR